MASFKNLLPLVILFIFLGIGAFIGYQMYIWSNEMADRGKKKMEKNHVSFTKDGMKVGVKELSPEELADKQQSYLVSTWNNSSMPNYKSFFWNKEEQARQKALARQGKAPPTKPSPSTSRHSSGISVPQQPQQSRPVNQRAGSNPGAFPDD